jgi:hypothetical protein
MFWKVMPPVTEFTAYEAGKVYEKVVEIQNVSGVARRLRVLQPDTPLFTLSLLQYPQENGNVAPGMVTGTRSPPPPPLPPHPAKVWARMR